MSPLPAGRITLGRVDMTMEFIFRFYFLVSCKKPDPSRSGFLAKVENTILNYDPQASQPSGLSKEHEICEVISSSMN